MKTCPKYDPEATVVMSPVTCEIIALLANQEADRYETGTWHEQTQRKPTPQPFWGKLIPR